MTNIVIEFVSLFLAGILAGEEFVVRYGVHVSLAVLDEQSQIQVRQALIRRLRVLVPAILLPTAVRDCRTIFRWLRTRLQLPLRGSARLATRYATKQLEGASEPLGAPAVLAGVTDEQFKTFLADALSSTLRHKPPS